MKTARLVIIWGALIPLVTIVYVAFAQIRDTKRAWPRKQLDSAAALGTELWHYYEEHGDYPDQLADLVDSGQVTAERYEMLKFRSSPLATKEAWLYHRPDAPGEIAIVAPDWILPWGGHSG